MSRRLMFELVTVYVCALEIWCSSNLNYKVVAVNSLKFNSA